MIKRDDGCPPGQVRTALGNCIPEVGGGTTWLKKEEDSAADGASRAFE